MNSGALWVMWDRQLKEFFRNKQRVVTSLFQPLLFLFSLQFGIGAIFEESGNGNYLQFLIPGIVGISILMTSTMNGMSLIWDKQFGFLKETLVAPVSRTKLLFGRCLGGATTSTIQGIIVLIIGIIMGFKIANLFSLPLALLFMFSVSLLFNLFGTVIAAKFDDTQSFPTVINFLIMPMFFLSGALFPIENFPKIIQLLAKFNPFSYCVDLIKHGLEGIGQFRFSLDIIVIFSLIFVLGFVGTKLFDKLET